ncbi:MAG: hypothetical protein AUG91_05230 [Actinobacteria bacterium 13_1_20CM_4_69_9]|nr:MAG: hypothetical protein AUG91_05230 [Actinobacteria bacterium 13_1_20CM_4_69_9]
MKVLVLIYGDEEKWDALTPEEAEDVHTHHRAFAAVAAAKLVNGAELAATQTATTVRVRDGQTVVTDGPFAETKEVLGGFYLLDCNDLEEAAELSSQLIEARTGAIELRAGREEAA